MLRPTPPACSVSSRSTRDSPAVPLPSTSLPASSRDTSTATSTARTLRPCVRLSHLVYPCPGPKLTLAKTALVHVIGTMILLGYAQNYYFHLRMSTLAGRRASTKHAANSWLARSPQEQRPLNGARGWKKVACKAAASPGIKARPSLYSYLNRERSYWTMFARLSLV